MLPGMSGWGLVGLGLATAAISLWYARPQRPLPPDAGSWAPVTVPFGLILTAIGLVIGLSGR
jgi:hypothetical protein